MSFHGRWTYPSDSVARREQSHRRAVMIALAVLLLLSLSPLLGTVLPLGLDQHLAGRDHLWSLCLVALHMLMAPLHGVFHLLFLAGFAYAILDRVRAWWTQRNALGGLCATTPDHDSEIGRAAAAVGVDTSVLRVVEGLPSPAFTTGWIRPRIYLAAALPDRLSSPELEAVLAHEKAHAERRDPARLSLLRFLACMLFWLPAVARLVEDVADEAEVRADDLASRGRPLALASAIVSLAQWIRPAPVLHDGVAFDERDLLQRRVRRLAGQEVAPRSRLTRRNILAAASLLWIVWLSGAVMAHPLAGSTAAHEQHCEHSGAAALFHLFCAGSSTNGSRETCSHR